MTNSKIMAAAFAAVLTIAFISQAKAGPHTQAQVVCGQTGCSDWPDGAQGANGAVRSASRRGRMVHGGGAVQKTRRWSNGEEILPHPAGCPRYSFCGCGAAVYIFGKPIRDLWLTSNWGRFPRAVPAPGMAAYNSHHVFVIEAVNGDGTVIAYDANSGGGLTRRHTVSLRGYNVVNPRG